MLVALVIDVAAERCWDQHKFLTGMQERVDVLFVKRFDSVCHPFVHNSIEVIPNATLQPRHAKNNTNGMKQQTIVRAVAARAYMSMPNQSTAPAR